MDFNNNNVYLNSKFIIKNNNLMVGQVDDLDLKMINILLKNANTPYSEIAKALKVSIGTIHVRIKKLEALKIIKYFSLELDHIKIGYDLTAYFGIKLEKGEMYEQVITELEKIPEIVEVHYITGAYSLFAKIVCQNTNHLRDILHDKIQLINGIKSTETMISLEERVKRPLELKISGERD